MRCTNTITNCFIAPLDDRLPGCKATGSQSGLTGGESRLQPALWRRLAMRWRGRGCLVLLAALLCFCPAGVDAEGERLPLSGERVTETLRRYVLEQSAWRPEQVEIVLRSFALPPVPDGEIDLVILKPNHGVTPGVHRFLLSVRVNGREEARFWVDAEVRVFANVIVTSQPLAHYELLSAEKVRVERRDLGSLPLQPLMSLEELNGKQAARPIEVNQVLTAAMVELPRVIRRGGAVTLVYESAGLRVETTGRAAEPGRVGDRIHVENPSSGKIVEGHILDERTVKVN